MKRLLLIAAAALVPFAALVWWGLAALHEPVVIAPAPAVVESPPEARPAVAVAMPAAAPAPVAAVAPAAPAAPAEPAEPRAEEEEPEGRGTPINEARARSAVVEQLTPVVNTCFLEMNDRLKQKVRIAALFDTNPDGSITNVRVKMKAADPYLSACVQDAIEGARLDPKKGLPSGGMRHTFAFNPEGAK